MANESNLNSQNDKLSKLLDIDWIKQQDVSNLEDFSTYSEEDLSKMKEDAALSDGMTDGEKYWVRRNIDNIIAAKKKEQEDIDNQAAEEQRQKEQEKLDQEKAEAKEEQNRAAESLIDELNKEETDDTTKKPQGETAENETKENKTQTEEESQTQTESENNKPGEVVEPVVSTPEAQDTTWKTENYQEQIDELNKSNETLRQKVEEQSKQIEALLAAKKEGNTEEINKIKEDLRKARKDLKDAQEERNKLLKDNKKMKDTYFWELPKYNGEIIPLKTKAIEFKFGVNEIDWNQRVLSMPQLRLRKNIISRHRLNKTIRKLNEIGNNPKAWVNYILTKADFFKWGAKIWTLCKRIWKFFTIRDIDSFDRKFNEQKKIFIDDIESKMQWKLSDDDKKTLKAIKDRLDYYQKAYKRQFLTV